MTEDRFILPINNVTLDVFSGQTLQGETGPPGPEGPEGPSFLHNVLSYGAVGNGVADDTAAIQAAVSAAATTYGQVYIPPGTYKIVPDGTYSAITLTAGVQKIFGNGRNTVLKVDDAAGEYYSIFGYSGINQDVAGLEICDLTFDQNNTNNQWTTAATQYTVNPRYVIHINYATGPVAVRRCTFLDLDNTNTVVISGAVGDHWIEDNYFQWGSCPVDHDSSVIYTNPAGKQNANSVITGNIFQSPGPASKAARTAIETHGGSQSVTNNVIRGFQKGMNITGVSLYGYEGILVAGNKIHDAKFGIQLWSLQYSTNTTRGLKYCTIRDNTFKMNGPGWSSMFAGSGYVNVILRDTGSNLPFEDVLIEDNYMVVDNTGYTGLSGDTIGNAIEWRDPGLGYTDRRLTIRGNTIVSPLAAGIRLSVLGDSFVVENNIIRNPGQASTAVGGAMSTGSAVGIMVNGALTNSRIDGNTILDDQGTPSTHVGVYILPTTSGSANNQAFYNRVPVANSKKIDTVTSTYNGNWLVRMDHATYSALTGKATAGSTILDRSTGLVYVQSGTPEGTTWGSGNFFNNGSWISSGFYVTPAGSRSTAAIAVANTEYAVPIWFANTGTLVRIGVSITSVTSVTAGTLIRLGIRQDNGAGKPGSLLLDAGTVAGDVVASPEITISQAISTPGIYWLTATCQNAGATLPTVRVLAGAGAPPVAAGSISSAMGTGLVGYSATGVSGALGPTYTINNYSTAATLIAVRG